MARFAKKETIRTPVRENPLAFGRTRKRSGNVDQFHIPPELVPEHFTYQWCRKEVFGQPDTAHQIGLLENGWTPVEAKRHEGRFMPPGYEGSIERGGLILMERPTVLVEEARAEERASSRALQDAQRQQLGIQAPESFSTSHPGVRPQVNTVYGPGTPQERHQIAID